HGDAQVREVADTALGEVDVVVEVDVAGPHRVGWEVADDGLYERGVGATGELAHRHVVYAGPVVVGVADHRRARRAPDGVLDLLLDRGERPLDDLEHDRVDGWPHASDLWSRVTTRFARWS